MAWRILLSVLILVLLGISSMGWVRVAPLRSSKVQSARLFCVVQETESNSIPPVDVTSGETSDNSDHDSTEIPEDEMMQVAEEGVIDFSNATVDIDPKQEAIMQKEASLRTQLIELEERLRRNRLELGRVRDKVSESGKNGFFLVQAQVNDFLRKKDTELKYKVERNKKDFVEKMVPIVKMFRAASVEIPAETEKEQSMHRNFGSLLDNIVTVIDKYGYRDLIEEKIPAEDERESEAAINEVSDSEDVAPDS